MRRIASTLIIALLFLSLFTFAFTLQTARAQSEGTIYINPDGSITPSNANITTSDNVTYTFTGSNYLPIIVNRSNIIINGMGHTLQASNGTGFSLTGVSNVTIKNTTITNSGIGIFLDSSGNDTLSGNNITANGDGIALDYSSDNNSLSGNKVTANIYDGIVLVSSSGNVLFGNNIANNRDGIGLFSFSDSNSLSGNNITASGVDGIYLGNSSGNSLSGNNIRANSYDGIGLSSSSGNTLSGNKVTVNMDDGIDLIFSSDSNSLSGNKVTANMDDGIDLIFSSDSNSLSGNNITASGVDGIYLGNSSGNTLSGNNVTANTYNGIAFGISSDNNTLSGNKVIANSITGIYLVSSSGNTLSGNKATANNRDGIDLIFSSDSNSLSGNNITASGVDGVCLISSSNNRFFHNNFINNTNQVYSDGSPNTWDNGYPSGGNYWSDYRTTYPNATEVDSSGIWNTSYIIDANNIDHYPLMALFSTFNAGTWNNTSYSVGIVSNSTISNFSFNGAAKTLTFDVSGPSGTVGFCRVIIPKSLMWCNSTAYWTVKINGVLISNPTITNDTSYTYIYFTYHHSTEQVQITSEIAIPEFQPYMLLPLLMIVTLLTATFSRRKRKVKK